MTKRLLRPAEAQARLGIGHTQYYEWIRAGKLTRPVRLGPQSVGHPENEIDDVIDRLIAERDSNPGQNISKRQVDKNTARARAAEKA